MVASAVVGTVAVDALAACSDVTLPQSPPTSPSAKRPVVPCMMDRAVSLRLRVDGPMCALPARAPVPCDDDGHTYFRAMWLQPMQEPWQGDTPLLITSALCVPLLLTQPEIPIMYALFTIHVAVI